MALEISATTMSQSTARLKPSEVALPNPTSRLPRQRLTTAAAGQQAPQLVKTAASCPESMSIKKPLQQSKALLGRRSGPRPIQRKPGAPGAWRTSRIGVKVVRPLHFILLPGDNRCQSSGTSIYVRLPRRPIAPRVTNQWRSSNWSVE